MSGINCQQCSTAMAVAEKNCSHCGADAPAAQSALTLKSMGIRLEKEAQEQASPALFSRAGEAFRAALALDDSDEVAHQLFIANLGRQGQLSQAKEFYQKRLSLDASDSVAARQLKVIQLSADFLSQPPPVAAAIPLNVVERWLQPRPWKVGSAALTFLSSLIMMAVSLAHQKPVEQVSEAQVMLPFDVDAMVFDANLWGLQALLSALALIFMYRMRKR